MNWKSYVEKKNSETYVMPPPWDSRESVAKDLDCSPEKVRDHLRPGLRSGEIQEQQFRVWDENLKRIVTQVGYCETKKLRPAASDKVVLFDLEAANAMRKAGKTYTEIGVAFNITSEAARQRIRRLGR